VLVIPSYKNLYGSRITVHSGGSNTAQAILLTLAFREDLGSSPGYEYRVLELRGQASVRRDGRPPVVPHVAVGAPQG
jgi:hypothetical protein